MRELKSAKAAAWRLICDSDMTDAQAAFCLTMMRIKMHDVVRNFILTYDELNTQRESIVDKYGLCDDTIPVSCIPKSKRPA